MTVASPTESAARAVQKDIDKLQEELHSSACQVMSAANLKKNVHFSARHAVLNKAMESGELSRTFWADTIITIFSAFSAAGEKRHEKIENKTTDENEDENDDDGLLGPFDALLLREYLQDMRVEYTTGSTKVILTFKPNPFFEETQLWAEMMQELSDDNKEENNNDKEKKDGEDGEDGEDENDDTADGYRFSDITWKPGHGPENDDDDDDEDENNNKNNNKGAITKTHSGVKRDRNESATRGWSILEKFSIMPPHPEELDDEELEDDDDDDELQEELALATQEWEAEMEDRKEFLQVLVEDVWANPLLAAAAQNIIINNNNNNKEKTTTTDNGEPVKHCVRTE